MSFIKDRASIKYYIIALICVFCVYSANISKLFIPIFDDIYYGNLVKMFVSLTNFLIWIIEFIILFFVCKKLNINLFMKTEEQKRELPLKRVIILFILAILPMFIVSAYLHFELKIIYLLGIRVTSTGLACNACEILSWTMKILFMILFIHCIHKAFSLNFKFKYKLLNEYFPIGGILCLLVFGLLDFFLFPVALNWFYLIATIWYGIIYLVSNKKFMITYVVSYLIWLL